MAYVTQQVFEYQEHRDELATLSKALAKLQVHDIPGAIAVLMARQVHLEASQKPVLREYNQREELQKARS